VTASKTKRVVFWLLLTVYAAGCLFLCFFFPYNAERLYSAVPPGATLISEHQGLAGRWPEFARSAPARALCSVLGLDQGRHRDWLADPGVAEVVRRLASRNTLLAYVPAFGARRRPAWLLATWAGYQGQFIRMGFYNAHLPGFKKVVLPGGRKALVLDGCRETGGRAVSLAVSEGILLGCLSDDPEALAEIVARVDGGAPLVPSLFKRHAEPLADGPAPDRLWLPLVGSGRCAGGVRCFLTRCEPGGAEGEILAPLDLLNGGRFKWDGASDDVRLWDRTPVRGSEFADASRWLGNSPAALLALPAGALDLIARDREINENIRFVGESVKQVSMVNSPLLAGLCRVSYGGRILGFRTPTLILACRLRDPSLFPQALSDALDVLNARLGWGLIPNTTLVEGHPIVSVSGVKKGIYGRMGEGEHPAFSLLDGWLVCASNGKVLEQLIRESLARGPADPEPGWVDAAASGSGLAIAWAEIPEATKSLSRAVAVYDLMRYAASAERSSGPLREGMGLVLATLENQKSLNTLQARLRSDGREIAVSFRIER